jgi:hypothetical protein
MSSGVFYLELIPVSDALHVIRWVESWRSAEAARPSSLDVIPSTPNPYWRQQLRKEPLAGEISNGVRRKRNGYCHMLMSELLFGWNHGDIIA